MKTKAICSFFVLFAIAAVMISSTPAAFADHSEVTINPAPGSGNPGCELKPEGCWIPNTATVDVGVVVIFENNDSSIASNSHTFTAGTPEEGPSDVFGTKLLTVGESAEWIPETVGEFPYFCMIHPWMKGLIILNIGMYVGIPAFGILKLYQFKKN